ncbi:MAG TPA: type II secretion system protein, partial [Candidatus Woesebacteria bacterium]|nr:type II secretion system protein [Candidatus Woesebacteria bacterium]
MKHNKLKAFTLLELLVVIAIIGILISLGVASFGNAQRKSRDSRRREDMKAVQNGLEQYYADHGGVYPSNGGLKITDFNTAITVAGTQYFPAGAPTDPKITQSYSIQSDANGFCACASLETPGAGNATALPSST